MASSSIQEHVAQWLHNRAFLQEISLDFPDWIVTASLYVSIHLIEALLTADGAKARSRHQDRLEILQAEKRYERIYESFHILYNLAHVTRYSAKPQKWVPAAEVEERVIRQLMYPIETSVRKLLAKSSQGIELPQVEKVSLKPAASDAAGRAGNPNLPQT